MSGASAATKIETGYVKVDTNSVSDVSVEAGYAKVGSTVKVTYTGTVATNESLTLTYNTNKTVDAVNKVFSIKADEDITLASVAKVATFTVAAPTVTGLTDGKINGLTVTAAADKTSAKSGETVTVTVTIKGQASKATKLTTDAGNWDGTSSQELTIPVNTNYATAHTVIYTFTVSANATPTITAADA